MTIPVSRRTILRLAGALSGGFIASSAGLLRLAPSLAAADGFTLNGFAVNEPFASYWQRNGGLAQQGLPISERFAEQSSINGQAYQVQYFERAVFDLHPEYAGTENEVLLQLLGREQYLAKSPQGAPQQEPNMSAGSVFFLETGKRLGGRFLQYWQANGGLRQQGLPLSDEFIEVSAVDGKPYRVQYFERAVFELHPDNQQPYDVLLSLLGSIKLGESYPGGTPSEPGLSLARTPSRKTAEEYIDNRTEPINPGGVPERLFGTPLLMNQSDPDFGGMTFIYTRIQFIAWASKSASVYVDGGQSVVNIEIPDAVANTAGEVTNKHSRCHRTRHPARVQDKDLYVYGVNVYKDIEGENKADKILGDIAMVFFTAEQFVVLKEGKSKIAGIEIFQ